MDLPTILKVKVVRRGSLLQVVLPRFYLFVLFAVVVAVSSYVLVPGPTLRIASMSIVISLMGIYVLSEALMQTRQWFRNQSGSALVLEYLAGLPDRYLTVSGWSVPDTPSGSIDLVVIGPHGVLLVGIAGTTSKQMRLDKLEQKVKATRYYLCSMGSPAPVGGVLTVPPNSHRSDGKANIDVVEWSHLVEYVKSLPSNRASVEPALFT